ncbi:MAG: CopG family transcriptional regulator [Pseudomonadota bacterium]|jgi:predicted transcriptional regulator
MSEIDAEQIIVKLEASVMRRLEQLADARDQAVDILVAEAVAHFLAIDGGLTVAEKAAVQSWAQHKRTGLHLTADEADTWLAELEAGNDIDPPECHT